MKKQSTLMLTTLPQESLAALERAVARHFNWRILSGGQGDQPRFVIEKQVRYDLIRGLAMSGLFQIVGSLKKNERGGTTIQYVVSGQSIIPLFRAAIDIFMLGVITFLVGSIAFSPPTVGNPLGILLLRVLLVIMVVYAVYAYRSYQGHLRELHRFMEEFAQRMGVHPAAPLNYGDH